MARNEEKAQSMLARFRANKKLELEGGPERRPYLATECETVRESERWRRQIVGEIAKGISQIQNAGLGEFKIRDLNDDINKKMREKRHWEDRIRDLGGPNYQKTGPKMLDHEGKAVPGGKGYKYFGAARELPGVRELFQVEIAQGTEKRKTRGELMKKVDAGYYGYRDEEDGVLLAAEAEAEAIARQRAHDEWLAGKGADKANAEDDEQEFYKNESYDHPDGPAVTMELDDEADEGDEPAHLNIPSAADIEQLILQRKKQVLLEQYASVELRGEEEQAKELTHR